MTPNYSRQIRTGAILGIALLSVLASAQVKPKTLRENDRLGKVTMTIPQFKNPSKVQKYAAQVFKEDAYAGRNAWRAQAKDIIDSKEELIDTLTCHTVATLPFVTKDFVSGYTETDMYLNGAHGSTGYDTDIVAMKNGKPAVLGEKDIFVKGTDLKKLLTKILLPRIRKVATMEIPSLETSGYSRYYVMKDGIQWVFAPYEIGSYADGTFFVTVPWKDIRNSINWKGPMKPLAKLAFKKR